jgi:AraC-like DNA-binding protein
MDLLTDRTSSLEHLDSQFARLLIRHAEATHDWTARFDIVENIVGERLASALAPPAGLLHAWRLLQERPSGVNLAQFSAEFGCSRRYLIAQFHKYFGMAPKAIARISRFHLAVAEVHRLGRPKSSCAEGKPYLDCQAENSGAAERPPMRWADLALACGYYDQSHFINEFRLFSGLTPVEFLRQTSHE